MATRDLTTEDRVGVGTRAAQRNEAKPSFLTTEFYAFVASVGAILVAAAQADNFEASRAWTLVAAVTIGYMISRGLAKAGTAQRDRD